MTTGALQAETAWIVTDGRLGNERPCQALAQALGLAPTIYRHSLQGIRRALSPRVLPGTLTAAKIKPPWPKIVISAGRTGAGLSRAIRDAASGATFAVQILDPRIDTKLWDIVITPQHDDCDGENVISTVGSLHDVGAGRLESAKKQFAERLSTYSAPRNLLLLGGPHRAYPDFDQRVDQLVDWAVSQPGSLWISSSGRTPKRLLQHVKKQISENDHSELYAGEGDNPYLGYLAYADNIAVTPDSINMVSEALGVGVPVVSNYQDAATAKFRSFYRALEERSLINTIGRLNAPTTPLRETDAVAQQVAAAYRRWREP